MRRNAASLAHVLPQGDLLHVLALDQVGQADASEEFMNLLAEVTPQMVSQAGIARVAAAQTLATRGIDRLVHSVDDLGDLNAGHVARKLIADAGPSHRSEEHTSELQSLMRI